eukprot:CAMPEP_0184705382 /NCGR_PEP_ID=MMETSP0313-20130426/34181_1 /TAXON_ID=2792 /ORGANISM="Porphyridium aerugineum, Strain SAG 1380-2" /LENGTH=233 /DNA_ID=CAMNT_0027166715 /DNA_START=5 /DNA_END=706 /DNA_ORIENTATION=+
MARSDVWIRQYTWIVLLFCAAALSTYAHAFTFRLKPFWNKCLMDEFAPNTKVRVEFVIHAGGEGRDMPVNFWARPVEREFQKQYQIFKTDSDHGMMTLEIPDINKGDMVRYEFCMYHQYLGKDDDPKKSYRLVTINIDRGTEAAFDQKEFELVAKKDYFNNVYDSLQYAISKMNGVLESMSALRVRDQLQEKASEGLASQVTWFSAVACVVLVAGGVFEIFYVGHFLKKRKLV